MQVILIWNAYDFASGIKEVGWLLEIMMLAGLGFMVRVDVRCWVCIV